MSLHPRVCAIAMDLFPRSCGSKTIPNKRYITIARTQGRFPRERPPSQQRQQNGGGGSGACDGTGGASGLVATHSPMPHVHMAPPGGGSGGGAMEMLQGFRGNMAPRCGPRTGPGCRG